MNGIFHLGPTIGPLFHTYLTERCSAVRRASWRELEYLEMSKLTLIVKDNCQQTDCDEVEPTQAIVGPGNKAGAGAGAPRHSIVGVCKR